LADGFAARSSEPALGARRYELLRCERCGSAVTIGDAPAELHETGAYGGGTPRLYAATRPLLAAFDRRRLRLARELAPPAAKLLDAGAGRGRFVAAARAAGYDAWGIEPSRRGVEAARALGVPVQGTTIESALVETNSIEIVTLWHALEHLDDPGAALARIHEWLAPGGGLLLGVPNIASLQARISRGRWYHLDVPRHRVHFTPTGLDALLRRYGFTPLRTEHVLLEHNPFGMWQSLVNFVTRHPSYLYNLLKRNAPLRSTDLLVTIAALPLAPVAGLIELLAGLAGRGGTIAVLARRDA
jgi:SAM-dependent methyltransferase